VTHSVYSIKIPNKQTLKQAMTKTKSLTFGSIKDQHLAENKIVAKKIFVTFSFCPISTTATTTSGILPKC